MSYSITLTPPAIDDIQYGMEFYNSRVTNLGFRFAHEVDAALQDIAVFLMLIKIRSGLTRNHKKTAHNNKITPNG